MTKLHYTSFLHKTEMSKNLQGKAYEIATQRAERLGGRATHNKDELGYFAFSEGPNRLALAYVPYIKKLQGTDLARLKSLYT